MSPEETADIIRSAQQTFLEWKKTSVSQRARLMKNAAEMLRKKAADYGELMALEMGKPLSQGKGEAEKCAWVCDYYAQHAGSFLSPEFVKTDARKSYITFQPLGVILAIMPWNFPFWQVFRFAAPAIMAGNAAVLKHAPNVIGSALAIEEIFRKSGFPPNLFRVLRVDVPQVDAILENPLIRAVSLTGSVAAGRAVAKKAGEMLKKSVLELGGSDPYVILDDADLDAAVSTCVTSRLINSGQSCIAAKRYIVVDRVREAFEKRYVELMRHKKVGNPLEGEVDLGPQARDDLRNNLHRQVRESIDQGAKCLLGGEIPPGSGYFYPPTVLTGVKEGMPAYHEELFGPVGAIIPVKDEKEAVRVANDTGYGLGAAVFSRDAGKAEQIAADELEAGNCFVNSFVKSDPRLPFGGIKESGFGRELSPYGIKEFVNIKTIYVAQ